MPDFMLPKAATEQSTYQFASGPNTTFQNANIELINALYLLHHAMWKLLEQLPDKVTGIISEAVEVNGLMYGFQVPYIVSAVQMKRSLSLYELTCLNRKSEGS
jgi:hypothetical protein